MTVTVESGGVVVHSSLSLFSVTTGLSTWFNVLDQGTRSQRVQTPTSIEENNAGKITFAAVEVGSDFFVAAFYDSFFGSVGGGATVAPRCRPYPCRIATKIGAGMRNFPADLSWAPEGMGGFVLGPFTRGSAVCYRNSNLLNVTQAQFVDASEVVHSIPMADSNCISFSG